MLGAERLVYGHVGDSPFILRIPGTEAPPRIGEAVSVSVTPEHLHWFDPATQQRVG